MMSRDCNRRRPFVCQFSEIGLDDIALVGGKNASLGELTRELSKSDLKVPPGFVVTSAAYEHFIEAAGIGPEIRNLLADVADNDLKKLSDQGAAIRKLVLETAMPSDLVEIIQQAYVTLVEQVGGRPALAVRSSATAEDLPGASFAGQHESFLNVSGQKNLLTACRQCFASMFTDRAIAYRIKKGFKHAQVKMSVGVQTMVRADKGASGVMFSIDPETAFPDVVVINAVWGLGEGLVQGTVDPDEYWAFRPLLDRNDLQPVIYKKLGAKQKAVVYSRGGATRLISKRRSERDVFVLTNKDVIALARGADHIAKHYGQPMDIEWAQDGLSGDFFIVQARPETGHALRQDAGLKSYSVKNLGTPLVFGLNVGEGVVSAPVCRLDSAADIGSFVPGSVLVTPITDPDWVPIMQQAAAIVTDHGGRTSHAAIVCREMGLPGIVGALNATRILETGQMVTVSSLDGTVYSGEADVDVEAVDVESIPATRTQVMLNLANPAAAARWWQLPCDGVGLARMEFIINTAIKAHPMALVHPERISDQRVRREIAKLTRGWSDTGQFFVDHLAYGIARIAAVFHPKPVIVRLSDFKSNEYASLIGGSVFEPQEDNPMIGWRGASRYYSPDYGDGFALECKALKMVRDEIGLKNIIIMVPFCRTLEEADRVLDVLAKFGLRRGKDGLKVYVMCEVPSNVILAPEFAERFDGFSIGSNDLTQLTLGVDRDSERLAPLFREEDPAVTKLIESVIKDAHVAGVPVGLCGQAPSTKPTFAEFLVQSGINSISVTPDSFARVKGHVAFAEAALQRPIF
ncbi:MAG: phosphoenolpyruvate synthase [Rhodospirillaceae bacterium]